MNFLLLFCILSKTLKYKPLTVLCSKIRLMNFPIEYFNVGLYLLIELHITETCSITEAIQYKSVHYVT